MSASSLKITQVDVIPVEVPRRGTFVLQRGETPATSPYTVIRIATNEGVVGFGEGPTTVRSLHTMATDHLVDLLIGADPFDLVGIHSRMDVVEMMKVERLSHWNCVRCAIDIALHDILGKWLNVPVHQLLGGKQRDQIEVMKNISVASPEATAEEASRLVEEGYKVVKIRVGSEPRCDLARIEAVRKALGSGLRIYLDANQAWSPKTAIATINRLAVYDVEAVEQPCPYWDLRGASEVVSRVDVPIVSDEGFWTLAEAQLVLSARAADTLLIYLGKCGGLFPARKIAAVAEAFGAGLNAGERPPYGIAEAAHLHFLAALGKLPFASPLAYDLNEHDLLVTPLVRKGTAVVVPDGPGLGIEVDEEKLDFYTRR